MLAHHLTPILNVSNIQESFAWFEKLGWKKGWDWGNPPTFGGVCSGKCEIFLCENGQGGRPRDGTLDAIVCPHHGGHSNSPQIPLPPSVTHQRLIYPYGPNNSYKHPLFKTYDAHHRKNWVDVRKGLTTPVPPSPRVVRNTEDRKSSGLGHVGFDWTTGTSLTALACGADRRTCF